MKRRGSVLGLMLATVLAVPAPAAAQNAEDSCISCHEMLSGRLGDPVGRFVEDVHADPLSLAPRGQGAREVQLHEPAGRL